MIRILSGMLLAAMCCGSSLYAQFCSSGIESPDCYISPPVSCPNIPCEVKKRYGIDTVEWISPAPFTATSPGFGGTNCDASFYFDIKRADDDFANTLNSERANWSQDGTAAFFKGPNPRRLRFFDDAGNRKGFHQFISKEFFSGPKQSVFPTLNNNQISRLVSEIRWHPTDSAIIYPRQTIDIVGNVKGSELVKRTVDINNTSNPLGSPQVLFTFQGYTISSSADNFKIAGGDGNDVNAGRLLLSFRPAGNPSGTNQFAVYDFNQDRVVRANINYSLSSYSETFLTGSNFTQGFFSLPKADFDYATVSASGVFIVAVYSGTTTKGIFLYDLKGQVIQRDLISPTTPTTVDQLFFRADGHIEVGYFRLSDGTVRECIVSKASASAMVETGQDEINDYIDIDNSSPGFTQVGDIIAVYWNMGSAGKHQADSRRILDWQIGSGTYSGGQYSLSSTAQTAHSSMFTAINATNLPADYPFRLLLSQKPVDTSWVLHWIPYYGEIVELSLDETDLEPRRILHHRITDTASVEYQPEAWFNRTGSKFYFKSHHDLGTQQDLYFVDLPPRTCKNVRDGAGSPRMAAPADFPTSFTLYPNPLHSGGKLWLEPDATTPETASASLRLIGLDGRRIELWQGPVETGQRIQAVLPEVSAGIYVLELVDHLSQRRLYQEKVLVR
ncbi:MAG: hypothetical protein AAF399_10785 [Bacteroidota bacterium]